MRAMVVNAAQLATYSQAKQILLKSGTILQVSQSTRSLSFLYSLIGYVNDNVYCHFWASMISGLATTAASMPVDIAKTRLWFDKKLDHMNSTLTIEYLKDSKYANNRWKT